MHTGHKPKLGEVRIVQLLKIFILQLVILGTASAQVSEDGVRSIIAGVRYLPLAEAARIQGVVHFALNAGVATLLSGPPLLAKNAGESAKAIGSLQRERSLDLTYHFLLADTARSVPTAVTAPRGNAFERTFLRAFGLKTVEVIVEDRCQAGVPPPNDLKIADTSIEVWVYGRTFCVMPESATLVARR